MLVFDHELTHTSPLPILPDSIILKLHSFAVQIPPLSYFRNGTQSLEGLCSLVALCKMLCAHSVFEIGTFTGVTAFALAVNVPQLIVHTLDLAVGRVPALDFEKSDRTYIPLHCRQRVFEGRQEAARIIQHGATRLASISPPLVARSIWCMWTEPILTTTSPTTAAQRSI